MLPDYYDPDGIELTLEEWSKLFEWRGEDKSDDSWWRKQTHISNDIKVSTVWLGLNHSFTEGPPLFWETMIFGGEYDNYQWRYSSREEALQHHDRICEQLLKGEEPDA